MRRWGGGGSSVAAQCRQNKYIVQEKAFGTHQQRSTPTRVHESHGLHARGIVAHAWPRTTPVSCHEVLSRSRANPRTRWRGCRRRTTRGQKRVWFALKTDWFNRILVCSTVCRPPTKFTTTSGTGYRRNLHLDESAVRQIMHMASHSVCEPHHTTGHAWIGGRVGKSVCLANCPVF